MNSIGLFDCVTGQSWLLDICNRALFLDGISDRLGLCRYRVVRVENQQIYLQKGNPQRFTWFTTCFKVLLFATILIPLGLLLIKRRHMKRHTFTLMPMHEGCSPVAPAIAPLPTPPSSPPIKAAAPLPSLSPAALFPNPQLLVTPHPTPFIPSSVLPPVLPWPVAKPPHLLDAPSTSPPIEQKIAKVEPTPDPAALRNLIETFALKITPKDDQEIIEHWEMYRKKVAAQLTLKRVKPRVESYRALRDAHPHCPLFQVMTLKNSQGQTREVDRLLACLASPVIEAACRSPMQGPMKESQSLAYSTPAFDKGVLDLLASYIQTGKLPAASPQQLPGLYKAADQLQMPLKPLCQKKLMRHLFYDASVSLQDALNLWHLSEEHGDIPLQLLALQHLSKRGQLHNISPLYAERSALWKSLQPLQLELDEAGFLYASLPFLTEPLLAGCQRLGLQHLEVKSPIDPPIAKQFNKIKSLTLQTASPLQAETLSALLQSGIQQLNLSFCTLDEAAAEALILNLSPLNSLALSTVALPLSGLNRLASALQQNRTLHHLQLNYRCLDDRGLQILQASLLSNRTLRKLSLKGNAFSPKAIQVFTETLSRRKPNLEIIWF